MNLIEILLNIGAAPEKAGQAGKGKSAGKTGGKSIYFGPMLAELGKDAPKDDSGNTKDEVGVKKVKLRGGLEVEISYPKSLLEKKGSRKSGMQVKDPAILHQMSEKKGTSKGKTWQQVNETSGAVSAKLSELLARDSNATGKDPKTDTRKGLKGEIVKEATGIDNGKLGKTSELADVANSKNKAGIVAKNQKTASEDAVHVPVSDGKSDIKDEIKSAPGTAAEFGKDKADELKGKLKKTGTDPVKNPSFAASMLNASDSRGVTSQKDVSKNGKTSEQKSLSDKKINEKDTSLTQPEVSGSQSKSEPYAGNPGQGKELKTFSKNLLTQNGKPESPKEMAKTAENGKSDISKTDKGEVTTSAKLESGKVAHDAPKVVRDRYYGQRVVRETVQADGEPKDKVEIKSSSKPDSNSHGIGSDGHIGIIEEKSVKSPSSMDRNKQHPGGDLQQQQQTPDQLAVAKVKSEEATPKITANGDKTISHSQTSQNGNNANPVAAPAQVNVPRVVAERLISMVQKMPQTAREQQTWQKHRLVMDNGQTLNVSARSLDGVLHLQLSGGNQNLNTLLQQHMQEIRNHLQEQMHVQIDLQFHNESNGQPAQQFQQQQGNRGTYSRPVNFRNDLNERTAEPVGRPLSNRRLGYNNAEWTA